MLSFLQGGGELGALIRAKDWSTTPLGPPDTWPPSLKTAVGLLLNSRYPMFVFWGPELVKIYNDAYRPITGHKHPWALGRRAREVWPEIWADIEPLVSLAMSGDPTWSDDLLLFMERNGFPEEVYFTFSYSPIVDEFGGIGGMFCACTETTAEVLGNRRLRTLRDLAAAPSEARSVVDACARSAAALHANAADVPFVLIYLAAPEGALHLVAEAGTDGAPVADVSRWPIGEAIASGALQEVGGLAARFASVPAGPWPEPPATAVVLPLVDRGLDRSIGAMVLGVSSRRAFDAAYRQWFELVSGQVSTSIANARAAEEERRRAEALAELDRAKSTFFHNVSHEFRTPLTLMLAQIEDRLRAESAEGSPAWLSEVYRNGRRLQKLVNSLMEFSRIEAGHVQANTESTDLAAFTADLASLFRSAVEKAGLRYEVHTPSQPVIVQVDRNMWERIVLNLVSNAFKFTMSGTISVSLATAGDEIVLGVTDTGCGIPQREITRVFERFHRAPSTLGRTYEGTGIGLALVAELTRLHGGSVHVDSLEGAGSTFTVRMPAGTTAAIAGDPSDAATASAAGHAYADEALRWLPDDEAEEVIGAAADESHGPGTAAVERRPGRILVADDNADMRAYLRRLLGSRWTVTTVANGAEALLEAARLKPDVVVADVMMPGLDGFELLARLRDDAETRGIPVILLSARAGEESRVEGLAAGADDYIVKPFSSRELIARVEMQLVRQELRTRERGERERLSALFQQAPAAIAVLRGPAHVFDVANPRYVAMIGERSVLGRPVRDALPELEGQGLFELLDEAYRTGRPVVGGARPVMVREPGSAAVTQHYFDFVYQPMLDGHGAVEGITVIAFDVTDLVSARAAAESASRAKDEFLALLGHELRNPLAPIMTAVQLMRLRGVTGGEREQQIIERQVRHLTRLVDDLLDVARVARGKVELKLEQVEMADVVTRALETAGPLFEQFRHDVDVQVPKAGLTITGDPGRLAQVIANLLTNAAKYTEPGGRIRIEGSRDDGEVVLSVIDSGVGIPAEMMPVIFDLFVQAPQPADRSRGGLGIGLALVKGIVSLHGGSVSVVSAGAGAGSTFTIRLPYVADAVAGAAVTAPGTAPAELSRAHQRILVVDDNVDAAEMLAESLQALGFDVRSVHDAASALSLAPGFRPHLAILDIGLPVIDGYELAERLRQLPELAQLPCVALTGYGQRHDHERSRAAGFDAHLVKPVDLGELARLVQELTGRASRPTSATS